MHSVSFGVGLLMMLQSVGSRQLAVALFLGVWGADLALFRGVQSLGYLPAMFMGLLI